ncbi:hypothetical protein DV096_05560 [Bradymonadaceae bacterium TMQ3]|uniref:Tetratricopeptide repeat protein n=1 Tax=Lujinxingia sediminis TaxID=2480984 RepID=A0ABY0CWF7_9DELT|nr:hypothetical protein [Lujinxingia sediminis]RDV40024.1 hypothetical protein DV096_05560 [Bradymonadaceae bacterium TMQ3]RVU47929.1 hypothetical protein EA187_00390 [Lujinxingia sediminis]TXC77230.1 hypothetical protein FRC91_00385 [Bradymonadales bacterium TMQ1]
MRGGLGWVGGVVGALALLVSSPVWGQQDAGPGVYYGDGLRHLAEGRYGEALIDLHRAYGIAGRPEVLEAIVGAYDAMGFCEAATRQRELYVERHGQASAPGLERCLRVGQVEPICEGREGRVLIDAMFEVECGQSVMLAEGRYRMAWDGGDSVEVEVEAERSQQVELKELAPIKGAVARLRGPGLFGTDVQRLQPSAPSYTVYQSADGLYQLWVRPADQARRYEAVPRVEIVCPDDAGEQVDAGCAWLRELRRRSGYTDNPTRLEVVVPRVR